MSIRWIFIIYYDKYINIYYIISSICCYKIIFSTYFWYRYWLVSLIPRIKMSSVAVYSSRSRASERQRNIRNDLNRASAYIMNNDYSKPYENQILEKSSYVTNNNSTYNKLTSTVTRRKRDSSLGALGRPNRDSSLTRTGAYTRDGSLPRYKVNWLTANFPCITIKITIYKSTLVDLYNLFVEFRKAMYPWNQSLQRLQLLWLRALSAIDIPSPYLFWTTG